MTQEANVSNRLASETVLTPAEVERVREIWEQEERGDLELISATEVWETV